MRYTKPLSMYKCLSLSLLVFSIFQPLMAQQEDNWVIGPKVGLLRLEAIIDEQPRDVIVQGGGEGPNVEFNDDIPLRGIQAGVEVRHASSDSWILSGALLLTAASSYEWEFADVRRGAFSSRYVGGTADLASLGLQFGVHRRLTRPRSRFSWQLGLQFELAAISFRHTNAITFLETEADRYRIIGVDDTEIRGGIWGITPTTRVAFNPLPRFGIALDGSVGILLERGATREIAFGYVALHAGIFYEFSGK